MLDKKNNSLEKIFWLSFERKNKFKSEKYSMENIDTSKLVNHYFIDYLFASEDFLYPKNKDAYLNHDTVVYSESFNKLLILQPFAENQEMKFSLWVIDMSFILTSSKSEQSVEFFEKMKAEYFFKIQLSFTSGSK
ncbi:hypothetical protein EON73_03575 [bacterium]|nr:MAG: hypothetical protein EON73_03575 [bacterium]